LSTHSCSPAYPPLECKTICQRAEPTGADAERMSKMKTRRWLVLVPIVLAASWVDAPVIHAQIKITSRTAQSRSERGPESQRPSHMPVNKVPAESLDPQELLTRRLRNSRNRLPDDWKQFAELARKWMKDADFRKSIGEDFKRERFKGLLDQLKSGGLV